MIARRAFRPAFFLSQFSTSGDADSGSQGGVPDSTWSGCVSIIHSLI